MAQRFRNTKSVRTILRVENPDTCEGAYAKMRMYPTNRRTKHPASLHPVPNADVRLLGKMTEAFTAVGCGPKSALVKQEFFDERDHGMWGDWVYISRWFSCIDQYCVKTECPLRFGFPNMVYLRAWFARVWRNRAREMGLKIGVYEVHPTACWIGESQAVFFYPCARRVGVMELPQ